MHTFIHRKDLPYLLAVLILGTVNHFVYAFSGRNPVAALFTPINESIWEHMKLLFFPFLLASLAEFLIRRPNAASFFGARLAAVWSGILFVILLYYGYSGVLGRNFLPADLLLFAAGCALMFRISRLPLKKLRRAEPLHIFLGWAASLLLFFLFTCFPPELPLFLSISP